MGWLNFCAPKGASRRSGANLSEGAGRKWAQAILASQQFAGREDAPAEKVASADVADR
jgi:hypothetical protein